MNNQSYLQKIDNQLFSNFGLNFYVYRLDLAHLPIGGNKYFKLKYNLIQAQSAGFDTLLTFGGAYSNHILATALAGQALGLQTIGIIRGEETLPLNSTLAFAQTCGMKLHYLDRQSYRQKDSEQIKTELKTRFGDFYLIPEGGTNLWAVHGASEISHEIDLDFDFICTPCGTGGTLAGLVAGLQASQMALGFSVLKGGDFLNSSIATLLTDYQAISSKKIFATNFKIFTEYHFGGYAKKQPALENFIQEFQSTYQIPLEWIYTGKMFYGIFDLIAQGFFPFGSTIVALHTGGLR
ncbi:MAG: pyridoxal-phosphate dependent enzyme [Microscillaceae bacterium]|nr:pyridoxal-phosphate dependent enzyme [Microscillaceae bacterium]